MTATFGAGIADRLPAGTISLFAAMPVAYAGLMFRQSRRETPQFATLAGFALAVSSAMADTHFAMRVAGLISLMAKTLASTSSGRGIFGSDQLCPHQHCH
jgi:hypothetical protein